MNSFTVNGRKYFSLEQYSEASKIRKSAESTKRQYYKHLYGIKAYIDRMGWLNDKIIFNKISAHIEKRCLTKEFVSAVDSLSTTVLQRFFEQFNDLTNELELFNCRCAVDSYNANR